LDRVSSTLWIDAEEFEIARADVQLGSEADILGGVIGCLRKLAYSITRVRLAEGSGCTVFRAGISKGESFSNPCGSRSGRSAATFD
jgi:hypothetical protein